MRQIGSASLRVIFLSALLTGPVLKVLAQVDTGTVSGVVKDPTLALIPHATLRCTNAAAGESREATADDAGFYSFPDLKPGRYDISAAAPHFETVVKAGIFVHLQDRIDLDFELPLGRTTNSVVITGETPALEAGSSSLGQIVSGSEMRNLPLNGRNYIQLATLVPGTSPSRRSSERNTFVANGARSVQNSYLLDGIDNKNKILGIDNSAAQSIELNSDAIQEFKVQTTTFSAEFGQAAGAVVNVSVRAGTNRFRGTLFEYLRNSSFDALPYFQPPNSATPEFNQNQFGASLGGPLVRNRTLFFFNWQSTRIVNAAPQLASVPTEAEQRGVFPGPVFDPATTKQVGNDYQRQPFPNNSIPQSRWDPVAIKLKLLYPAPNLPGAENFFSNQKEYVTNDQFVGRVDHHFSDHDSMFGRYSASANTNEEPSTLPAPANNPSIVTPEAHAFAASEFHVFRSNLLNEVRVGYQETSETQQINAPRLFEQYGILGAPDDPNVRGLPVFAIASLSSLGTVGPANLPTPAVGSGNLPTDKQGRTIQFNDDLTWTHSKHSFKFGFDFEQVTLYLNSAQLARPSFNFTRAYTQDPQNSSGGYGFADFLLGLPFMAGVSTPAVSEIRQHIVQGYVQDDWKATQRLTLNLGLRYELPMPFYETSNNYADLILDSGPLYGSLLDAHNLSGSGYRNSFADPNWHNLAPRIGLAYRATQKTVIRTAFGLFFGRDENVGSAKRPSSNPPYFIQTTYNANGKDPPPVTLSQGFPADALQNASMPGVISWPKFSPTPYVQQWMFNLQREFGSQFVGQVSYVGSSSHDLYYPLQVDLPITPGPGSIKTRRPLPQYSSIFLYGPFISANYEALQASLERRFSAIFSMTAAYTWSHSIDNGNSQNDSDPVTPQNPYNLKAERGNSNFDVRQRFAASFVAESPFSRGRLAGQSRWVVAVLGDWQVTGILSLQTGLPFTPVWDDSSILNTGAVPRPNRIRDGDLPADQREPSHWFDATAFTSPGKYQFGNSGRNILEGPGFRNLDAGLSRFFGITESMRLEFRAEGFNVFNTPQFGLPNATLNQSTTGVIKTVVSPQRQLQLALRLSF